MSPAVDSTPYGGRLKRGAEPVVSASVAKARCTSSATAHGDRAISYRCSSPWTATSWPAATTSFASPGARRVIEPSMKNVAFQPSRSSSVRNAGVDVGSGPSSNVSAT